MFGSAEALFAYKQHYRERPVEFIEHWCYTFDPRNAGTDKPTKIPFILFPRQRELIEFLHACMRSETSGLVERRPIHGLRSRPFSALTRKSISDSFSRAERK